MGAVQYCRQVKSSQPEPKLCVDVEFCESYEAPVESNRLIWAPDWCIQRVLRSISTANKHVYTHTYTYTYTAKLQSERLDWGWGWRNAQLPTITLHHPRRNRPISIRIHFQFYWGTVVTTLSIDYAQWLVIKRHIWHCVKRDLYCARFSYFQIFQIALTWLMTVCVGIFGNFHFIWFFWTSPTAMQCAPMELQSDCLHSRGGIRKIERDTSLGRTHWIAERIRSQLTMRSAAFVDAAHPLNSRLYTLYPPTPFALRPPPSALRPTTHTYTQLDANPRMPNIICPISKWNTDRAPTALHPKCTNFSWHQARRTSRRTCSHNLLYCKISNQTDEKFRS